jgi:Exostosin family
MHQARNGEQHQSRHDRDVCGCAGDGWARRAEDAVLHGCIPVIIMDRVEEKFSNVVDYGAFSLRIAEVDAEKVRPNKCTERDG